MGTILIQLYRLDVSLPLLCLNVQGIVRADFMQSCSKQCQLGPHNNGNFSCLDDIVIKLCIFDF